MSVKDRQFINDDGDFLNNMIEGYIRATAKITLNTDDDNKTQSVSYIISLYDKTTNRLIDIKRVNKTLEGKYTEVFTTPPVLVNEPAANYKIKTFIWMGNNTILPMGTVKTLENE